MKPEDGGPSLSVLGGPLARTSVSLATGTVRIGSDPACELRLALPGVPAVQAQIVVQPGGGATVYTGGGPGVWVNDDVVSGSGPLHDGDILWLGPPGSESSVMLQVRLAAPGAAAASGSVPGPPAAAADTEFFVDAPSMAGEPEPAVAETDFIIASQQDLSPPPPPSVHEPRDSAAATPAGEDAFYVDEAAAVEPAPSFVMPEPPPVEPMSAEPMSEEPVETFVVDEPPPMELVPPPFVLPPVPPAAVPPAPASPPSPVAASAPVPAPPAPPLAPVAAPAPPVAPTAARRPAPPSAPAGPAAARPASSPKAASRPSAPAMRPATARPSAPARRSGGADRKGVLTAVGIGVVVLVIAGLAASSFLLKSPDLVEVRPARARAGDTLTLSGKNFSADPEQNEVLIGDQRAQVVRATATEIDAVVPALPVPPGQDTPFAVKVRQGGRETKALTVALYQAPRILRLSPDVGLPGEEIVVEGSGFGPGAVVRMGTFPAEVVGPIGPALRVRIPAIEGTSGTAVPVVVTQGSEESPPVILTLGRIPLITSITPASASPGTLVIVAGKGFVPAEGATRVDVAGVPALVAEATESSLKVLIPDGIPADAAPLLSVRVPGKENAAELALTPVAAGEIVDFHFSAEPFDDLAGHHHALVTTALGPMMVLSASGGRSASRRAIEAVDRLNAAAVLLKASLDQDIVLLGMPDAPVLALTGKAEPLIEVTEDDVAAYAEDWTRLGGKGGPVTRTRLATWWHAVFRDLVLLLVRGQPPRFTAALGAEGKILGAIHERSSKTGRFGVPRELVTGLKPPEREAVRLIALRVPATVVYSGVAPALAPAAAAPVSPAAAAAAGVPALKLEGVWLGFEIDEGRRRPISATFDGADYSTLTYTGTVNLSVPLSKLVITKDSVKFTAQVRGGTRHYEAKWDGQKLRGTILSELAGKAPVGTFELAP